MFAGRWTRWIMATGCCLILFVGCGPVSEEGNAVHMDGETVSVEEGELAAEFSSVAAEKSGESAVEALLPASENMGQPAPDESGEQAVEQSAPDESGEQAVEQLAPDESGEQTVEQPVPDESGEQTVEQPVSNESGERAAAQSAAGASDEKQPSLPPLQAQTPQTGGHVIAIDAGHQAKGNKDKEPLGPGSEEMKAKVSSGTRGVATGVYEYELNLTVAQALKAELEARGYTVVMIRDSHDVDISNKERAETANTSGAEIFLRIHANGSEKSSVHGTLTICNTASSPYNPGIHDESLRLAQEVLSHMVALMGSKDRGVWETDTMSGINWSTIPVTIVEMGYMSNEDEDRLMQTDDYQSRIVQGIADGVDAYFCAPGGEPN